MNLLILFSFAEQLATKTTFVAAVSLYASVWSFIDSLWFWKILSLACVFVEGPLVLQCVSVEAIALKSIAFIQSHRATGYQDNLCRHLL